MTAPVRAQVLIVDDQLSNRQVLTGMLGHLGCACETAECARVAIDSVAAGRRFDIIFIDLQMPQLDGFEATRQLRELTRADDRYQVILAISAAPNLEHRQRAFRAGVDDFLEKPLGLRDLRKALDLWCGRGGEHTSTRSLAMGSPPSRPPRVRSLDLSKVAAHPEFDVAPLSGLCELSRDGSRLPIEVVGALLAQIPQKRQVLSDALAWRDGEILRQTAHLLGGGARNVGAVHLARLCDALQNHMEQDSSPAAVAAVSELVAEALGALDRVVWLLGSVIGEPE